MQANDDAMNKSHTDAMREAGTIKAMIATEKKMNVAGTIPRITRQMYR